jgi:MoxR-like ATPase
MENTENMENIENTPTNSSSVLEQILLLKNALGKSIIGQQHLIERMIVALLCGGHLLVEGAPGLAKTRAVRTLSELIEGEFHRIQFTPDLLPSDLTGTDIYRQETGEFIFQSGPIFNNMVLADEINRAPAKVQSALLEAMGEGQVTIGTTTYPMPELFMVMATQNPIEQEGTYPLPEAQLDRFLMHILVDYPDVDEEREILRLVDREKQEIIENQFTLSQQQLKQAKQEILQINVPEATEIYIIQLIAATRNPQAYDEELANLIEYGASPRGTLSLLHCARALSWLNGNEYVTALEVQQVAHDVLRHRILLSLEAESQGITSDQVITRLLDLTPAI